MTTTIKPTGTAYLTTIQPLFDHGKTTAIYAVHPPAKYPGGETTLIGATTTASLGDTCLFPAEKSGRLTCLRPVGIYATTVHKRALAAAGYELEAVTPRVRA